MPLLDGFKKSSDMNTQQIFLLISADAIQSIDATEALTYLRITSSLSWAAKRHRDYYSRTQERMTSFQGIHPLTGDTVCVTVHPVFDSRWLMTVIVHQGRDAGTPSAATPPLSPSTPTRRASRIYRGAEPDTYKMSPAPLNMSKRGHCYTMSLLPCRGQKASRGLYTLTVNKNFD